MKLKEINELTKAAYDKTANKYHINFKDEVSQKEYDRLLLDKFSSLFGSSSIICDAGCGPSSQAGRYLHKKGYSVTGIDISPKCVELAKEYNPGMDFRTADIMNTGFRNDTFDGIVSYYSIIYTPKEHIRSIFSEFHRIMKPEGYLFVVVKKGTKEGIIDDEWYEGNKVFFTYFLESEINKYFNEGGFSVVYSDVRKPYDFEIDVDRIYTIGKKKKL
jgi:ubiquinone/menaquinone biosynthesis C-methylase UbiE